MTSHEPDAIVIVDAPPTGSSVRSADAPEPPEVPPPRWLAPLISVVVPAAAALTLVAIIAGERARVDCDLHVQVPTQARPGSSVPVRALFYGGLSAIEGPRLIPVPTEVALLDAAGMVVLSRPMVVGVGGTLEATLPVASTLRGPFTVRVTSTDEQTPVVVEQGCTLSDDAPPLVAMPRPLRSLQQFAAGPVRRLGEQLPPASLEARIVGGACVPELPCEVLLHVGEPAAVIVVEPYGGLDVLTPPPIVPSASVVRAVVRVHGPEAELRVSAHVDGHPVAQRSFRLAIAQAMVPLQLEAPVVRAGTRAVVSRPVTDRGCVVDGFDDERWVDTFSVVDCGRFELPDGQAAGAYRVQVRDDAFDSDVTAVRFVYRRAADDSDAAVLQAIAQRVAARDRNDRIARRVLERSDAFARDDFDGYAAWLLSSLEVDLIALPRAASSHPAALVELTQKRERLRNFALIALALSGTVVVAYAARRGLRASARAREIMHEAGDMDAHSRVRRLRMTFTVIASVATLAMAFIAVALYVLARGW